MVWHNTAMTDSFLSVRFSRVMFFTIKKDFVLIAHNQMTNFLCSFPLIFQGKITTVSGLFQLNISTLSKRTLI